jgi:Uma2 family endonuclease
LALPDISFFAKERLQGMTELPIGFLEGAPDLAVEVLSSGNTIEEIHDKLVEYFENGSRLVWLVHPLSTTSWCIAALKSPIVSSNR